MGKQKLINKMRKRRKNRTRAKISGTSLKPRLSIYTSNRYSYAQLIDDELGKTLISVSTRELGKSKRRTQSDEKNKDVHLAFRVGELIAKKAAEKNITEVIFDRGRYKYHGRVKAVAEGARKSGLKI